jgi:hypothetical protein
MSRFSPEVEDVLRGAGWTPERRVDVSGWTSLFEDDGLTAHQAALDFLQEFGGLNVRISGPGRETAKEPFEIDPSLCEGEGDRFTVFGEELGRQLFPLGELDNGRFFLAIDENSEIYLVESWAASFGTMPTAIENLVLGGKPTEVA